MKVAVRPFRGFGVGALNGREAGRLPIKVARLEKERVVPMRTRPSLVMIFSALIISLSASVAASPSTQAGSASIFRDDFDGEVLSPDWEVNLGNAWIDDGWVVLQHLWDGVGPRDTAIMTNEGGDWSDYRVSTRFVAEGGGDGWYRGSLFFRVADYHGWPATGSYYKATVATPLWVDGMGPLVRVVEYNDGVVSVIGEVVPPDDIVDDFDNTIDVEAVGGHLKVWVNGWLAIDAVDPDPVATGGVGLGAVWESRTRYDFIDVTPLDTDPLVLACGGVTGTPDELAAAGYNVVVGTDADDFLKGSPGNDFMMGLDGRDVVLAGMGDDVVCAGGGHDVVVGGGGNDVLQGDAGNDRVWGGNDVDLIAGGTGKDLLVGGDGGDEISGDGANDTIRGGWGDDVLRGGAGKDDIRGDGDNDMLFGDGADDVLRGQHGTDVCDGGSHVQGDQAFTCETQIDIP